MRLPTLRDRRRLCFDVQLAVSELVSSGVVNAHRDETLRLGVHADDRRLRIEVRSHGAAFQPYDEPDESRPTSHTLRGLQLVAAVADRWGVEWQDGSLVWAEFDLPAD
jgi:anti-sigma regulatory factor (Ser/Thr protein kinase)